MRIILLDKIKKLGNTGSEIVVRSGYARNFLIPQAKAMLATEQNLKIFKEKQNTLQSGIIERKIQAELHAKKINDVKSITITAKSNIEGKLFGSIGPRVIAKKLTEVVGLKISKSQIRLPNREILKSTGRYNIKVHIYDQIFSSLDLIILSVLSQD